MRNSYISQLSKPVSDMLAEVVVTDDQTEADFSLYSIVYKFIKVSIAQEKEADVWLKVSLLIVVGA